MFQRRRRRIDGPPGEWFFCLNPHEARVRSRTSLILAARLKRGGTRSGADDETVSLIDVLQRDLQGDGIAEVPQETAASQRSTPVVPRAVEVKGIAPRRPRRMVLV